MIKVMDNSGSIIFLTDKYGKRNRSTEIESISPSDNGKFWHIKFYGNTNTYTYKDENVQIIKNSLKDKNSVSVFDYLMQMAQFSEIRTADGQNLLVKNMEKARFVNDDSVLARYLNPSIRRKDFSPRINSLIFPFGCNKSQLTAVRTALNNPVSIIQGPPGTGKTQTILNIIANLLINNKTVLVVSNNNTATANVLEKLSNEKYGMDFICATLGKTENINAFIQNQKEFYPEYLNEWRCILPTFQQLLDEDVNKLEEYFGANERIAEIKSELSQIELEFKYFQANQIENYYSTKRIMRISSKSIMKLLQVLQFKYTEKERFGIFLKWKLKIKYGLGEFKFWNTEGEKAIATVKSVFYPVKIRELKNELAKKNEIISLFNPEKIYTKCLDKLKHELAIRYTKKAPRIKFETNKDVYFNMSNLVREYPVIMSTTFSSRSVLGGSTDLLFDYVIMDEASQVDVVTGAIAMSCCKNAVIVGDKQQLPNVIPEREKTIIQDIFRQTKISEGYNFIHSFLSSLELVMPETPQTLLREHYRCHPKIINFCNQQFYGGKLLIMTEDRGEENVLTAIKTLPGKFCTDHYNQRQIDVIKSDILPTYSDFEKENLGIIAPYNNQTNSISRAIPGIDSATVHKYQGREKDNIIISTVDDVITKFADDSNMLNVAVSRAKKKLAIVISGNDQPENSNLVALLKYIEHNNFTIKESKVSSIFDFMFTNANQAKFEYLIKSKKISKFKTENAMNALLERIFAENKYSKFGFVFELPLKDVLNQNNMADFPKPLLSYANKSWSHVDFAIYNRVTKDILFGIEVDGYNYHKSGTVQAERDKKKNEIFSLIGMPLLRFSTRGSGEESIIRTTLDKFLVSY